MLVRCLGFRLLRLTDPGFLVDALYSWWVCLGFRWSFVEKDCF